MGIPGNAKEAFEADEVVNAEDTVESAREKAHRFMAKYHGWTHHIGKDENVWCGHPRDVNFGTHESSCLALQVVYEAIRTALVAERPWSEDELPNAIQKGARSGMYGCRRASTRDILLMLQRSQPTVREVMEEARKISAQGVPIYYK